MTDMPSQWSDDHTLATADDDGVTVNGALIPWATLADPKPGSFGTWLLAHSMRRRPNWEEGAARLNEALNHNDDKDMP